MRILVSGASGILGGAITEQAAINGHQCIAIDRKLLQFDFEEASLIYLDRLFAKADIFIHAAANTNVELCEINPSACYKDNVLLTELLLAAARKHGTKVVYISSTGVYGSHKHQPYREFDEALPETQHHKSKYLAEQLVLSENCSNLVIRTGWLFGGGNASNKNFVAKRIQEAKNSKDGRIFSNRNQRGSPTYVVDLAARLFSLVTLEAEGVFNVVNEGSASRYEYVTEIVNLACINVEVDGVDAKKFKRIAPVSNNEMAENWRSAKLGLPNMRDWKSALSEYIRNMDLGSL